MLNEYVTPEGKLYCPNASQIIDNINHLTGYARARDWPVLFINTALDSEKDALAEKFGFHARRGSWAAHLSDIIEQRSDDLIITKKYYDGFFETDLDEHLKRLNVATTIICGIHTHVCILLTAVGAFNRGYDVIVVEDAVTTDDRANHDSRLPFFRKHVGRLVLTAEITS
jgi:nicotinamidase-related amidase